MKIDIIVVHMPRYRKGHEVDFVPPLSGIHLAGLTPDRHSVRVIHQQVEEVRLNSDADVIALSFFTGFAPEAYRLAMEYRKRGKIVVAGGPHVTFSSEEALQFVDSVVAGEAESVWCELLLDIEKGTLRKRYIGEPQPLAGLPATRYDLIPRSFFIRRVIQATRGCSFNCSFCMVPVLAPGFRTRPIGDVIRDIRYDSFPLWHQRKLVWFWDDNLTVDRSYAKELLRRMIPLRKWWLTQASLDIAKDSELLDLMRESGCIGIFFGIESFGKESLKEARKQQNTAAEYRQCVKALHERGICVMAGLICGFDGDTPRKVLEMSRQLDEIGIDVPFLSILTPYPGTASYERIRGSGRLRDRLGWEHYNGFNVSFIPRQMDPVQLLNAHRDLWRSAFHLRTSAKRILRSLFTLRWGALLMCAMMNGFYGFKAMTKNEPISFEGIEPRHLSAE